MRCLLAAFDQAHRADDGSYWTWRHPDLPSHLLDAFYYDCAAKHWPEGADPIPTESLRGGCTSVGAEWVCWYRFVDGGRDKVGRPGRYILLAAFVAREDHLGRDWSGLLESPQWQHLASQARIACPVPVPNKLELDWKPPLADVDTATADNLRRTGRVELEGAGKIGLISGICSAVPPGEEFDCFFVRKSGSARITFTLHQVQDHQPIARPERHIAMKQSPFSEPRFRQSAWLKVPRYLISGLATRSLMRTNRQTVNLIIVFLLGAAIGMFAGWHLRGSNMKKDMTPRNDDFSPHQLPSPASNDSRDMQNLTQGRPHSDSNKARNGETVPP